MFLPILRKKVLWRPWILKAWCSVVVISVLSSMSEGLPITMIDVEPINWLTFRANLEVNIRLGLVEVLATLHDWLDPRHS